MRAGRESGGPGRSWSTACGGQEGQRGLSCSREPWGVGVSFVLAPRGATGGFMFNLLFFCLFLPRPAACGILVP